MSDSNNCGYVETEVENVLANTASVIRYYFKSYCVSKTAQPKFSEVGRPRLSAEKL